MDGDLSESVSQPVQDGDNVRLAITSLSPKNTVPGNVLNRSKRCSASSHSSRGSKQAMEIDISKATDESDADSELRMAIHTSDSDEREAAATESDKDAKHNGADKIASSKRKANSSINLEAISDDEDFAGFTIEDQRLSSAKKFKSESGSSVFQSTTRAKSAKNTPIKSENVDSCKIKTESNDNDLLNTSLTTSAQNASDSPSVNDKSGHLITKDPRYRKPFQYGWKREVVFRANLDPKVKVDNKGEVYYHTPSGKKLRTKAEILSNLRMDENLDIGDFSFAKERIGMPPDQEIVRSAKIQTPSQKTRPVNFLDIGTPNPALGFGKRIPKPKMPKGASPPPSSSAQNRSRPSLSGQKKPPEPEIIQQKVPKPNPKAKGERDACTIQCVLAMGMIPHLRCKKCMSLFHPECVGHDGSPNNYICEVCLKELVEAEATKSQSNSKQSSPTPSNASGPSTVTSSTNQILKDDIPKSSTKSASNKSSNEALRRKGQSNSNVSQKSTSGSQNRRPLPKSGGAMDNITTRPPQTAKGAHPKRPEPMKSKSPPPQEVAIVAGRKYIMVPKTSGANATPTGVNANVNGQLSHPVGQGGTRILTTGEDITPPARNVKNSRSSTHTVSRSNSVVASSSVHTLFASEFFSNISRGYNILLHTFQYLKVQELLRASRVCRMWNQVANNSLLWQTVRMKNSQVNDWSGLTSALKRHGTRHLDLRKVLIPSTLNWSDFLENIGDVTDLETIDLCKCPAEVVSGLFERNRNLRILNALAINGDTLSIPDMNKLSRLTELRLKAVNSLDVENLGPLQNIKDLKYLSLTSMKGLDETKFNVLRSLTSLETLELGECCELTEEFGGVLTKLVNLKRLRLEKGQDRCHTFVILDAIAKLPNLAQVELVHFDVTSGFENRVVNCKYLKRLLLIPTYISQSATTNNVILAGIAKLKDTLEAFTWVVTQELLRVTELYIDQCDDKKKRERRPQEDKIPILKPVPLITKDAAAILKSNSENAVSEAPQVEILPLHIVEDMIRSSLPNLKLSILKVPFHATWRQTMTEMP